MEVCPTEVVLASAERVWELLTDPRELARWSGTKLVEGPARPLRSGDRLVLRAGVMRVRFEVLGMEPPRWLALDIALPFGITNHERIEVTPAGAKACQVTFN